MKYVVSAYTETISNGSASETDEWWFDAYEAAKAFFDGYDIVHYFEVEAMTAGRMNAKTKKFVVDLAKAKEDRYGSLEITEVLDHKETSLKDIDR